MNLTPIEIRRYIKILFLFITFFTDSAVIEGIFSGVHFEAPVDEEHYHPYYMVQIEEHPSPFYVFPSSQAL